MPTIFDVAREAGVSTAAVSLVLNDPHTTRVGAVKRKEILRVARKLGYTPNVFAKGLAKRRTGILGLVVPMRDPIFFNHFIAEVLAGIQSFLMERGYHLMIYSHAAKTGKITRSQILESRYVDGLIFFNTRMCAASDITATIDELTSSRVPFVMVNAYYGHDPVNYVGVDDREIGFSAGRYLCAKGHRRIALLDGARRSPVSIPIRDGFRAALDDAGIGDNELSAYGEFEKNAVHQAVRGWMRRRRPPTAIFCSDDQMAPDVYDALQIEGRRVPGDVAVIGRGDLLVTSHLTPKLTTIRIPLFEIGRRAAELLAETVQDGTRPSRRILLPTTLVERDSV
jgi:LacI family transcriptional regulator